MGMGDWEFSTYHPPDQRNLDVVNPDVGAAVKRNRIAAPDILRVQICDGNVLHDDVLGSSTEAEAFAFDDPRTAHT